MANDIKVIESDKGIDIHINGNVKLQDIESMAQNCTNGGCDCSPEMLASINDIQVNGTDGEVHITLKGNSLNNKEVQNCMDKCDCDF